MKERSAQVRAVSTPTPRLMALDEVGQRPLYLPPRTLTRHAITGLK